MEIVILPGAREIGRIAGGVIADLLTKKPAAVLGLATGSSPLNIYDDLVARYEAGEISFAHAKGFTLDEYVGLPPEHPQRYRNVIERDFTGRVDFARDAVHGPDGLADDLFAAASDYDASIAAAGGIDLQILGIGTDGHIAFNEPGSSLASRTRLKTLAQQTRVDNARFFGQNIDEVPIHCITQGLGTIMEARHIALVASGAGKAEAIRQLVEGAVSALWPATILQHHPHVTVLIDEDAASGLTLAGYYRHVQAFKPAGQSL